MSFLEVENLDIQYLTRKETINASQNVSFHLDRGEILGIVGESGSGKSTVANAIINLIDKPGKIIGGSIKLDNIECSNNEKILQNIRGKKIHKVNLPAKNITNCTFGGPKNNELYATSALKDLKRSDLKKYNLSGSLFNIMTNTKGVISKPFNI